MKVEVANAVLANPHSVVTVQVCVEDMWVGIVWVCILIFVWLRGKIREGRWCCEVVGSCEVQQVARCGFLLPRNLIKTSFCVCQLAHHVCLNAQRIVIQLDSRIKVEVYETK